MESLSNGKRITTIDISFFFYNKSNVVLRFLDGISFPSYRKGNDDEFNKKRCYLTAVIGKMRVLTGEDIF